MENLNRMYTEITIGGTEYKLRLGAQQIIDVEKKLGGSIITVLMGMGDGQQMIELEKMLIILNGSMQKYNHGITITKVYDLYDDYVDENGSFMELVEKLIDVITVSGFFSKAQVEQMNKKPEVLPVKVAKAKK